MKIFKYLIIILTFSSFLSVTVSSKSLIFCLEKHNTERFHYNTPPSPKICHDQSSENQDNQSCFKWDCYSSQVQINFHNSILDTVALKSNVAAIISNFNTFSSQPLSPPPRTFS